MEIGPWDFCLGKPKNWDGGERSGLGPGLGEPRSEVMRDGKGRGVYVKHQIGENKI